MSIVGNASYVSPGDPIFIPYGANDGYVNYLNAVTISTGNVQLDGVSLDGSTANGGQLLINGVAVATVNQNVSSITNWATYPALSTINYAAGGGVINMASMNASQAMNAIALNATNASTTLLLTSSINGFNGRQRIMSGSVSMYNGQTFSIDCSSLGAGPYTIDISDLSSTYGYWGITAPLVMLAGFAEVGTSVLISEPPGTQPSTANMLTIQTAAGAQPVSTINVYMWSTRFPNAGNPVTLQWTIWRNA